MVDSSKPTLLRTPFIPMKCSNEDTEWEKVYSYVFYRVFITIHLYLTKKDCKFVNGFSSLVKCTSALCQLAYGTATYLFDEHLQVSETLSLKGLCKFCRCGIEIYFPGYLWKT